MKFLLVMISIAFLTSATLGQETGEIDLRINGVRVGSSYRTTLRKLGPPMKEQTEHYSKDESCLGEPMTFYSLDYEGLDLGLLSVGSKRKPVVFTFEVTSDKWAILNIRIGATEEMVRNALSKPHKIEIEDDGSTVYYYEPRRGTTNIEFTFRDGRLVKISQGELIC